MNYNEYLQMVGLKFKIARLEKRYSIERVSKLTGLRPKVMTSIEHGRKDSHILTYKRIADVLGKDLKDLF